MSVSYVYLSLQGSRGEPGIQGHIGPRGLPGFCEHEIDIDGSGGSGELEENLLTDWKGLMPASREKATVGLKGAKGSKVSLETTI